MKTTGKDKLIKEIDDLLWQTKQVKGDCYYSEAIADWYISKVNQLNRKAV